MIKKVFRISKICIKRYISAKEIEFQKTDNTYAHMQAKSYGQLTIHKAKL